MLVLKQKQGIEYTYDIITKLYLNPLTNKWVKNIRFQSGKNIGKNKDKKYIEEYNRLKELYSNYGEFSIITPINLSDSEIINSLQLYNNSNEKYYDFQYNIEDAKFIINIIIVKSLYNKIFKSNKKYIDISKNEFIKWYGVNYKFYLDAMIYSDIIECDDVYYKFEDKSKALGYKLNDKYFKYKTNNKYYKIEELTNWRLKSKTFKNKIELHSSTDKIYLQKMKENVECLFNELNFIEIFNYYSQTEEHLFEFYNITNPTLKGRRGNIERLKKTNKFLDLEQYFLYFKTLKEGLLYFNLKDQFGERFHSVFTNMKSVLRKWVKYNNTSYIEIDIINSQMSFFSLLLKENDKLNNILFDYRQYLNKLKLIQYKDDVNIFYDKSLNGKLYEWIQQEIGYKQRKTAKINMFRVLFSKNTHFKQIKNKLIKLIPNIINICNEFNTKYNNLIPKLCQLLESRIMIHNISCNFIEEAKYPFLTVHDSVLIHPDDKEIFLDIYNNTFKNLYLPILKIKNYNDYTIHK